MKTLLIGLLLLIFSERIIKHLLVIRFFRLAHPKETSSVTLISILQPILSGDPTMPAGLEQNLSMETHYPLEFLWLADEDDEEAKRICRGFIERYPEKRLRLILVPPPGDRQNPKMVKLIAGAREAQGDILCVLDDDTRLPNFSLEICLPYLNQPRVGLAFGLPYYVSFHNIWSSLVAYFVNSHSLMSYVPYAMLTQPFTINGMFYAIRRNVLDNVGGFEGLENILADDFAIAHRMRERGYLLAQTPVRHSISTWVGSARSYFNLIHRWFTFPRESIMHYLKGRERVIFYMFALIPIFFPGLALIVAILSPSLWLMTLLYFAYDYFIFAHLNLVYLNNASPWAQSYLVILIALFSPLQVLTALLAPQRVIWRGNMMQAEPGGSFRFIRRREKE